LKGHIVVIDWGLTANLILRGEKNKYVLTCRDYQVLLVRGPGFCYDSICDFAYLLDLGFFVIASGDIHVIKAAKNIITVVKWLYYHTGSLGCSSFKQGKSLPGWGFHRPFQ
jgi:hypothetical protein